MASNDEILQRLDALVRLQSGEPDPRMIYETKYLYCDELLQTDAEELLDRFGVKYQKRESLIKGVKEYSFTATEDKYQQILAYVKENNAQLLVTYQKISNPGSILPPNLVEFDKFYPGCNRRFQGTADALQTLSQGFVDDEDFLVVQRSLDAKSSTTTVGEYTITYGQAGDVAGNVPVNASVRDQTIYKHQMRGPITVSETGCSVNVLWVEWDNSVAGLEQQGFLDTLDADFTGTKTSIIASGDQLQLSGGGSSVTYTETLTADFTGTLSDVQVSNDAVYLGFTASSVFANIVASYSFDVDASDDTGKGFDGTLNGATLDTTNQKLGAGCLYFNGSSYVRGPTWNALGFTGDTSKTLIYGVKFTSLGSTMLCVDGFNNGGMYDSYFIYYDVTANSFRFWKRDVGAITLNFTPQIGVWYMLGVVFDAGNNEIRCFVNNSKITISTSNLSLENMYADFGHRQMISGYELYGYMDQVFFISGALSDAQMSEIYNSGNWISYSADYVPSGTYTQTKDLGAQKVINQLSWNLTTPTNTALSLDYRFSDDGASWTSWTTGVTSGPVTFSTTIARYVQVRWNFSTSDVSVTPSLQDWSVQYAPTYADGGTYVSGNLDAGSLGLVWTKLTYGRNVPSGCGLGVFYKVGDLETDLALADWQSVSTSVYPGSFQLPPNHQRRWLQYKLVFSGNQVATPSLQSMEGTKG